MVVTIGLHDGISTDMNNAVIKAFLLFSIFFLTGCGGLFLYPDRDNYFPDAEKYVIRQEGFIPTADGEKLHYWVLPAQKDKVLNKKPKGFVILLHGNAQNLTAHVRNLGWVTAAGYNLAIFDYRGYGQSSGSTSLKGVSADVVTALDFATKELNPQGLPVCLYGQSLGGTLLLKAVSQAPARWKPSLIVVESSFFDYREIGREKMAQSWITWPLQWLPYFVLHDKYSLKANELKSLAGIPKLLFYSTSDPIVPIHHGRKIFDTLPEPKSFYTYPQVGHIVAMWVQQGRYRDTLVDALDAMKKP